MKLAVSNIAWDQSEEAVIADALLELGVADVEIAPTKIWPQPLKASLQEIHAYGRFWKSKGFSITSFQSLLFGRPDLTIFDSADKRREGIDYLDAIMQMASILGAGPLVYGSPKNRLKGDLPYEEAQSIAIDYFEELAARAVHHGVILCLEPNPTTYGCDFVTTAAEGLALVEQVNSPGFRLHLDAAGMTLAGDDIEASVKAAAVVLAHCHISEPFLGQVGPGKVDHVVFARALLSIDYQRHVSIEMKAEPGSNLDRVKQAVNFVKQSYGAL